MPPSSRRRVERSMKNRTIKRCRPEQVHTSTVKKSVARICSQCRARTPSMLPFDSFRSGLDTMPLQNISDRVTRQPVTDISESTLDPQISPASVFVGETKNKRSNLRRHPWAARCTARAAVILLGNQLPMPSQQGCRRDDGRDLFQDFPAELLRPCGQTATLVVSESHPSVPNLFSKDAIFLGEIFNDMLLVLVHPASGGNDQKKRMDSNRSAFSQPSTFNVEAF
jgi:hypothetical protein